MFFSCRTDRTVTSPPLTVCSRWVQTHKVPSDIRTGLMCGALIRWFKQILRRRATSWRFCAFKTATNITWTKEELCGPTELKVIFRIFFFFNYVKNDDKMAGWDKRQHRDTTVVDKYRLFYNFYSSHPCNNSDIWVSYLQHALEILFEILCCYDMVELHLYFKIEQTLVLIVWGTLETKTVNTEPTFHPSVVHISLEFHSSFFCFIESDNIHIFSVLNEDFFFFFLLPVINKNKVTTDRQVLGL